jgi:hypothetical protein
LLHECIGTRQNLARWNEPRFGGAVCTICQEEEEEDTYYFAVGCPNKWRAWKESLTSLEVKEKETTRDDIWRILCLDQPSKDLDKNAETIGRIYASIWSYHWMCFRNETIWYHQAIMNMIQDVEIA